MQGARIFVGYFSGTLSPNRIAGFVYRSCPKAKSISVIRKLNGTSDKQYCCSVLFTCPQKAVRAMRLLSVPFSNGKTLIARSWTERGKIDARLQLSGRQDWKRRRIDHSDRRAEHLLTYTYEIKERMPKSECEQPPDAAKWEISS